MKNLFLDENNRFLEFRLGDSLYALPLLSVKEVISMRPIREFPNCPSYFLGVIDLRGQVIPVIDLCKKFNLIPSDDTAENAIIIVFVGNVYIGVKVDMITQVIIVDPEKLEQHKANEAFADYLLGFHISEEDVFTALIDLEQSLDMQDVSGIKQVLTTK